MPDTVKYTEAELVALLKQRSRHVFSYLYDNYSGSLYSVILSIIGERELCNDVLQEVFVKIWKQTEMYDADKGRLFTWMVNIARNASIDVLRSKGFKQNMQNRELNESVTDGQMSQSASMNTDKIGLRKLVHLLKDDHKVLLELSYFQGYTQDEISTMLAIPLGTVKTRMRSALLQLREMVK